MADRMAEEETVHQRQVEEIGLPYQMGINERFNAAKVSRCKHALMLAVW